MQENAAKTHIKNIEPNFKGELSTDQETLKKFSHDASLFEIKPQIVASPKDTSDISMLVEYVSKNKKEYPNLSLTARSGGTDMSGGSINESIIVNFKSYINKIGSIKNNQVVVEPGAYYRDLEKQTLAQNLLLPSYPASKDICMLGGMLSNNSGGEKSLICGKTEHYVRSVSVILRDGKEYTFKPLNKIELDKKLKETSLDAEIYRKVFDLINKNKTIIEKSRPKVSKNATAYNIWDVWNDNTFDITKLIIGAQGTLGIITKATVSLVPAKPLSGMLVVFLPSLNKLGEIINTIMPFQPTSLESFDDHTLRFAFRFFFSFRKTLGWRKFILLGLGFVPLLGDLIRYLPRLPKIILLTEFEADNQKEIDEKLTELRGKLSKLNIDTRVARDRNDEEKFWTMRRESFNLLRKNVKKKHTAPFIDDLIVPPEHLPEFLPRLTEILERYKLTYTVAGHMGDGNFHIIPLMELQKQSERDKIYPALNEVTDLVLEYEGSLSGEHNDGLIRGPIIERMYGKQMTDVFRQIKTIFDPNNIFNPHKKTDANLEYSKTHIRKSF